MTGLIMKIIICPLVLLFAHYIIPGVEYAALYQPVLTGLILAGAAYAMEVLILKEVTSWLSTAFDLVVAFGIVFLSQFVLAGTVITVLGALITAVLLGITEVLQHNYLIRTDKVPSS